MTEEHYYDHHGELHVIYLGPSEILDLPSDPGRDFDIACYDALADLEAKQQSEG